MEQKLDCDMRHFNLINQELYCDASDLIQLSKSLTVTLVINLTEQELDCDAKGWTCFCTWCFYTSVDNIAFGTVHIRISISIYRWCRGKTAYPTFSRFQDAVIINLFLTGTLSFGIRGFVFSTQFSSRLFFTYADLLHRCRKTYIIHDLTKNLISVQIALPRFFPGTIDIYLQKLSIMYYL